MIFDMQKSQNFYNVKRNILTKFKDKNYKFKHTNKIKIVQA